MISKNTKEVLNLIDTLTNKDDFQAFKLKELLLKYSETSVKEVIKSIYAIDIAIAIEDFSDEEFLGFHKKIDSEHTALILEQASERLQRRLVILLDLDSVIKIFDFMSNDDIADIIGTLPINKRKLFLNFIRSAENVELHKLLQYHEDTAGGIMTTEYISLKESLKVSDALSKIKEIGPKTEIIETIFVLDNAKKLVGTADLRDIFTANETQTLADIMDDNIVTVTPDVDQEEVSSLVSKYDLKAISVINRKGALLGIITVDDIIDVLLEEQTEDILKLGGVSSEESVYSSISTSIKIRLPWLLLNLATAFLASFVVSRFEGVIKEVVALSAIMPIVAGMSGNAGSQTLAIIIRGITLGEVTLKDNWTRVFKEICVSIINGLVTGLVAGLVIYIMYGNPVLSLIILSVMVLCSIVSSTCGFFIPLTLKALKLDPALASNIFLTTATDTMAFLILLGLANIFINQLL